MESWLTLAPERPTTEVTVDVTFLELRLPRERDLPDWPEGYRLERWYPDRVEYLAVYRLVGASYCWWMRYMVSPEALSLILLSPATVLYRLIGPEGVAGFFELDLHRPETSYLSYLGLVLSAQGRGLGWRLLRAAIHFSWQTETQVLRVNTCTADHPNALSTYRSAGFMLVSVQRERWAIPDDLNLALPSRLISKTEML